MVGQSCSIAHRGRCTSSRTRRVPTAALYEAQVECNYAQSVRLCIENADEVAMKVLSKPVQWYAAMAGGQLLGDRPSQRAA